MKPYVIVVATIVLLLGLAGCGTQPKPATPPLPVIRVHVADGGTLDTLPFVLAQKLNLYAAAHLRIKDTSAAQADIELTPAGVHWPIIGYLAVRTDVVLVSSVPDPGFRLRALDHSALLVSGSAARQRPLTEQILAAHHARPLTWSVLPLSRLRTLWTGRHPIWALISLPQAEQLYALTPSTTILAWLGASTGPVPVWTISAKPGTPDISRFLATLNLALWYLHTTPAGHLARVLTPQSHPIWIRTLRTAQHYELWPLTTFPDRQEYERRQRIWDPTWPEYPQAVDPEYARQALAKTGQ